MLTGDDLIRLVRCDGLMLIGELFLHTLKAPRVIMQRQDGMMMIVELVGQPKELNLPESALSWKPTDEKLVDKYRENVTGLVIAKPGLEVVKMGGRA